MMGELDFAEALHARVALLEGLTEAKLQEVHGRLTINPGMAEFSKFCQENQVEIYLVSGGFTRFAAKISEILGFTGCRANQLEVKSGVLTGKRRPTD